jgi:TPR repeat protein
MSEKKLSEAESDQREALAIRKKLLGDEHLKVAESLSHLAEVLLKENRDSEAAELSQQAMDITTRLARPRNSTIDRVQAGLLEKQGKVAEAEKIRREELDRQKLILGLEHPDVASSLSSLSKGYRGSGQLSNAIVLAEKAFQSLKSKFGETNSQTLGAFANLAILYGQAGRPSDLRALEKELKDVDLAQEGMPRTLHNLGIAYRVCGSYEDSLRVWHRAAEKGDARCTASIGWAYANGAGVPKDRKEAVKWYIKAAELGDLRSFRNIGVMYEVGSGVAKDMAEAIKWFTRGAEAGETDSQIALARHYRLGEGCATNLTEAAKWYQKAAAAGNPTGLVGLLIMAQRGQIAESPARLEQQLNQAADQADVDVKYQVARWYETGEGLPKDAAKAARWYAKVTENAHSGDLNNLAWRLATASEANGRDGTNAIVFAEKAVALTKGSDAGVVDTLAAAYAEAGDFRKAVATQEQAIALLSEESAKREYQTRLDLYRAGHPYHPTTTPDQQDASNQ